MSSDALRGRVAIVTGASGGIGAAICGALAARGAIVGASYGRNRDAAERLVASLRDAGARAAAFEADMEQTGSPANLVAAVESELGPVDVLVAAHGLGRRASFEEVDGAEFDRTLAINLRAPFLLARAVLPGMRAREFGRVVFISSVAAFTGGVVGPHYAASKAGLNAVTHFLASRVAGDGVTVNAVAPGLIETAMLPGDAGEIGSRVPVGRVGQPDEVAELVLAVLGNGYLTNQVLSLDGGIHPR